MTVAPKDKRPAKARGTYLTPIVAGTRLLHFALQYVFGARKEVRVKWAIQVSYENAAGEWMHTASYTSGEAGEGE